MSHITNPHFTEQEKMLLEFILQYDFDEKALAVTRLNRLKAEEIVRDVTPYYHIMEFRTPDMPEGYDGMREVMHLQVARVGIPTIFNLYQRRGQVFEHEIFRADSSALDLKKELQGEVLIHKP